jgi:hypothetical protein
MANTSFVQRSALCFRVVASVSQVERQTSGMDELEASGLAAASRLY